MSDREPGGAREPGAGRIERVRRAVRDGSERLEAARGGHPLIDAAFQVVSRDRLVVGGLLASAVAFRFFLWIVPAAVVFVSAFGFYAAADPAQAEEYAAEFGVSAFITGSVSRALEGSDRGRWLALVFGVGALAWASRSLAVSLRSVHAIAWDIRPVPPIAWSARAVAAAAGLIAGIAFVLPAANWLREYSFWVGVVVMVGSVVVFAFLWTLVSAMLPRPPHVPVRALVPGALLVGAVVELLHLVSLIYLPGKFDRASTAYGSLGVAIVALAWLYFAGRAVVAGSVLNVTLWDRADRRNVDPSLRDGTDVGPRDTDRTSRRTRDDA